MLATLAKMGCATSKVEGDDRFAVQQNANIEKNLRQDKKRDSRTVKILLLGMIHS